jgi:hypothetical protein
MWNLQFPCWTVELKKQNDDIVIRVKEIDYFSGLSAYYPSALHAGIAISMIPIDIWKLAHNHSSYDSI